MKRESNKGERFRKKEKDELRKKMQQDWWRKNRGEIKSSMDMNYQVNLIIIKFKTKFAVHYFISQVELK